MRKEALIASLFGILVGLIVAFGVWRFNSSLSPKKENSPAKIVEITPIISPSDFRIILSQPEENDVITSSPISIVGLTNKGTNILVSAETEDFLAKINEDGSFSQDVPPVGGLNQILLNAFTSEGKSASTSLNVVYSTELAKLFAQQDATPSANEQDAIRNKVKAKIESVRANPKAYIGSVTDKVENSLQIKDTKGEIELISVDPDAQFIKIGKTQTNIKFTDVAIGDFIIAMGIVNANPTTADTQNKGVLTAKRVLVTSSIDTPTRKIYYGQVISNSKKILTLKPVSDNEVSLPFPKTWKGPEISEINNGDQVIAVSAPDSTGKEVIRSIFVIKNSN